MRVLQIMAGAREGGAESFFVTLVLALHRAGLEQQVVIRGDPRRRAALRAGGLEPLELPFGRWTDFTTQRALRRMVRAFAPEIVLTWMNRASAMMPPGGFLRLARLGGYYDLKHYRRCDHLICNTPGILEHVVGRGWPRARAHYLANFARVGAAAPLPRASLDTPEDATVVLGLGRLHPAKAFDVLLRALALEPRAVLWLAGSGPLRRELEALAERLGIASRVRFLGWRDDRDALFAAADLCVVPSRSEPFGNVVVEAWAQRKPLVAAASAGPAGLVRPGEDGLLVPLDDAPALAAALTRLLDEPDLAQQLAAAGRARYEAEFTEEAGVARYLALFERLLDERRARRSVAG